MANGEFGNGRGIGITELLRAEASWPTIVLFGLITQLGDVWFLSMLGGVLYVVGGHTPEWDLDRRRGLFVLALLVAYISLVGVLKGIFASPRPPGAVEPPGLEAVPVVLRGLVSDITTASGHGFPSGHALGTTMVWGGAALVLDRGNFRTRIGIAVVVVAIVSLSRLVLGVHYLVDVVVGVAIGLVALLALYRLSLRGTVPGRVLGAAVLVGLIGAVLDATFSSVAALGGALGGWLVWRWIDASDASRPSNRREILAEVVVLAIAGILFGLVYALEPSNPITFVGSAVIVGSAVGAPVVGQRLV